MKAKVDSIFYLGFMILVGLMTMIEVTHADEVLASPTPSLSTTQASEDAPNENPRAIQSRKNKSRAVFYLGVCTGQTLAKQGVYYADVASGASTGTQEDLREATRAALKTCKEQFREARANATATPAASPTPTPGAGN